MTLMTTPSIEANSEHSLKKERKIAEYQAFSTLHASKRNYWTVINRSKILGIIIYFMVEFALAIHFLLENDEISSFLTVIAPLISFLLNAATGAFKGFLVTYPEESTALAQQYQQLREKVSPNLADETHLMNRLTAYYQKYPKSSHEDLMNQYQQLLAEDQVIPVRLFYAQEKDNLLTEQRKTFNQLTANLEDQLSTPRAFSDSSLAEINQIKRRQIQENYWLALSQLIEKTEEQVKLIVHQYPCQSEIIKAFLGELAQAKNECLTSLNRLKELENSQGNTVIHPYGKSYSVNHKGTT